MAKRLTKREGETMLNSRKKEQADFNYQFANALNQMPIKSKREIPFTPEMCRDYLDKFISNAPFDFLITKGTLLFAPALFMEGVKLSFQSRYLADVIGVCRSISFSNEITTVYEGYIILPNYENTLVMFNPHLDLPKFILNLNELPGNTCFLFYENQQQTKNFNP